MFAHLEGLVAAPFTPMHKDGSVKLDAIEGLAAMLAGNGVRGAFVCGTTGESMSLTVEERLEIGREWCRVAPKDFAVVIHTGHLSLSDCEVLAQHAQKARAYAIAGSAPFFFKPRNVDELVGFSAQVAAAAPRLPFYFYHIPSLTGVNFPMFDFLQAGSGRIPNLAGVKFTYENLMDFHQCLDLEGGRFDMLFGRDEILLAGLALGARGAIGSTYNFAAPVYHRIISAFNAGDIETARAEQARARDMIAVFIRFGGLVAGKAMMKMIGMDCGPVRAPLVNLAPDQFQQLHGELDRIGFFQYASKAKTA